LLRSPAPSSTVLNNAHVRCLHSLLGDCSRAGGTRRFSRVDGREVPKTCSGAFRTPGRCGLLSESSSQHGTEPPATAIPAGLDSRTTVRRMADPAELARRPRAMRLGWLAWAAFILRHSAAPVLAPPTGRAAAPWGRPLSGPPGLALDIRCLFAYTRAATGGGSPADDPLRRARERVWFHGSRPRELLSHAEVIGGRCGSEPGIENFGDYRLQSCA
jgi:hypothetical protein